MVNQRPAEPKPVDEAFRVWLVERLDFMRALIESGADCMIADSSFQSHDARIVRIAAFHFYEEDWLRAHRVRRG